MKRIENRLMKIKSILDQNPLRKIIEGREKANSILTEHKGDYKKILELINPLAAEEKRLFAVAKLQSKNTIKYINEQVKLEFELGELHSEIYFMELRDKRNGHSTI